MALDPDSASASAETVLVVEDDASQRELYQRWLELDGYRVVPLADGVGAFARLMEGPADAVCLDLGLEGLTGMEVLERIRSRHPHLSVVILTADDRVESAVQATRLGAFDYLTKPVARAKLITTVRNAVQRTRMGRRLQDLEDRSGLGPPRSLIGDSEAMTHLYQQVERVAGTDVTALIHGESGTGKELVARSIHDESERRRASMVTLNCAAIPQSLQESELFGHEKGAFTGATSRREGRFELADGGTLFLDEVGELAADLQPKLLRVLQERRFQRVGGSDDVNSDFRLIAATNRDLRTEVSRGRFREDLFFRIAVFEIHVPPLRQRGEDILLLADHFARTYGGRHRGRPLRLDPEAADRLAAYPWPGNVRELQNAIQHAVIVAEDDTLMTRHLPDHVRSVAPERAATAPRPDSDQERRTLRTVEREMILTAMRETEGNVSEVARRLELSRTTLYARLKEYGLR